MRCRGAQIVGFATGGAIRLTGPNKRAGGFCRSDQMVCDKVEKRGRQWLGGWGGGERIVQGNCVPDVHNWRLRVIRLNKLPDLVTGDKALLCPPADDGPSAVWLETQIVCDKVNSSLPRESVPPQ